MKRLLAIAAALAVLTGCESTDPTQRHDYGCTTDFGAGMDAMSACLQLRITEVEGNAAETQCENNGGSWDYHACSTENRVPGYCEIPDAADYTLSGKPAKVYFYSVDWDQPEAEAAAQLACESEANTTWVPAL
jgi:hypothetical protein